MGAPVLSSTRSLSPRRSRNPNGPTCSVSRRSCARTWRNESDQNASAQADCTPGTRRSSTRASALRACPAGPHGKGVPRIRAQHVARGTQQLRRRPQRSERGIRLQVGRVPGGPHRQDTTNQRDGAGQPIPPAGDHVDRIAQPVKERLRVRSVVDAKEVIAVGVADLALQPTQRGAVARRHPPYDRNNVAHTPYPLGSAR